MAQPSRPAKGILIELSNIVFTSSSKGISLSPNTFKWIQYCAATTDYMCGRTTLDQYYDRLCEDFKLSRAEIEETFATIKKTIAVQKSLVNSLAQLKARFGKQLKVYAIANLSLDDYAAVKALPIDWSIFDQVFISGEMGMRKPEARFFNYLLDRIDLRPEQLIMVDDDSDNVMMALSLGMHGEVFTGTSIIQSLINFVDCDAVGRGRRFLRDGAGTFDSETHDGVRIKENFAQLLIYESTGDKSLIEIEDYPKTWCFFIGEPVLTVKNFPHDFDTTSLGNTILDRPADGVNIVMDQMLQYLSPDSLVQTYFTDFKNRVDPVVCCNVLSLFYKHGRGEELAHTLAWVRTVLENRAYMNGTRFYPMPEAFLFFFHRFLKHIRGSSLYDDLCPLFRSRLQERVGVPVDPTSLSMRLLACHAMGIPDPLGLQELLAMQMEDGGWPLGTVYMYGSNKLKIGNRGLTTAWAVQAVEACQTWPIQEELQSAIVPTGQFVNALRWL
ncbi:uncharacterized protein N7529_008587, partial [Penicillium soppii]|uniref:uncharacterized protein n=1 Tax=Penicillium soppii TaxID=69789 RepID=UPI00254994B0